MFLPAVARPRRPRPVAFAVSLLVVWLLLALLAIAARRGPIEKDLGRRASEAVRRVGVTQVAVTVAGTSVTLHGDFPSLAAAQTALRAARVDGVSSAQLGADARVATQGSDGSGGAPSGDEGDDGARGAGGGDEVTRAALAAAASGHPVTFARGSAALSPADLAALDGVAIVLRAGALPVVVAGHADSTGPAPYNEALSVRRAEAAVAYLVGRGVPAARLRAVGLGESHPAADNATPAGRAANRRVEITPDPSA
ncbi:MULTISPECIES: OmpA family protein [Pseudofrankia]|uniref:OmpA family protein n=1 Tax=Pseudofrankia TaxID=2994363 RepID=UPI000234B24C|nr:MULTISPECIES: OmpA family protein [Pseudofrankia]OHV36366.1 hypothetical protein BCD49_19045 [Pseudofrankia sp. EUN1h]